MKLRLLSLLVLVVATACQDARNRISGPPDPSKIISDGAHGGNTDFFFLPPLVRLPLGNPDFELGKFNNTLKPSLRVEICELKAERLNGATTLPMSTTECVAGAPLKTFAPGSVGLVNLPIKQSGWWTILGLPADGFYYVLWNTQQSNLNVNKYYRIKVFISGVASPLGVADIDPISNLKQWKYTLTGEVIQLVDGVQLPIPFRIENGGGAALCGSSDLCVSKTVTNSSPSGFQTVTVDGGAGAIAGVKFPNGWLPANGPQNVVVTIAQVDLGATNPATGTLSNPCHAGLPLQQFAGCFKFTTTPTLAAIDENGNQFAAPVTVAVCYVLQGSGDPREKFAEMYASGPNEPPHPLVDASDAGLLSPATRNCTTTPVIGSTSSTGIRGFAMTSWHKLQTGMGTVFGVRKAYAVDLGLGGITKRFSNIGPALSATIEPVNETEITATIGASFPVFARLVGSNHHDGQHQNETGLGGLAVSFTVAAGNGTLSDFGSEGTGGGQIIATTNTLPIDVESPTSGGGYAAATWHVPSAPGTYHITVNGPAVGGPLTFTANVIGFNPQLVRVCGTPDNSGTPTVADLGTAAGLVAPGGVVTVCGGTHQVGVVNLTGKSVSIVGEDGPIPVLDGGGQSQIFSISSLNPDNSVVVLRHLRLQNATISDVDIEHNFGSVLIDDLQFLPAHGVPPNPADPALAYSSGVSVFNSSGSPVTVQNSYFTAGDIGVHVNNSANVSLTNNVFDGQTNAGIHGDGGIVATRNLVKSCGVHWCIGLFGGEGRTGSKLIGNTLLVPSTASARNGIQTFSAVVEMTGNVITVDGLPPEPGIWPMENGVAVDGASSIIFNGNQLGWARVGLSVFNGTSVTGTTNNIANVVQPLNFFQPGIVNIASSNFTNYTAAFAGWTSNVTLRCNWWGSVDGPVNVVGPADASQYTPWALQLTNGTVGC